MEFATRLTEYWMCGLIGGLVHDLLAHKGLKLWGYEPKTRIVRLGFIGSAILGVAAAVIADGTVATAFCAAIAAPHIIEAAVARTLGGKPA